MDESYRQLDVWKKSVALTTKLYELTAAFPEAERHGLASDIRKSASSVVTHIEEGWGHQSSGEFILFWTVARSSLVELGTHLTVASNLGFLKPPEHAAVSEPVQEIGKMLNRLMGIVK